VCVASIDTVKIAFETKHTFMRQYTHLWDTAHMYEILHTFMRHYTHPWDKTHSFWDTQLLIYTSFEKVQQSFGHTKSYMIFSPSTLLPTHLRVCERTHTHTYTHTRTQTHTHTHTHTHKHRRLTCHIKFTRWSKVLDFDWCPRTPLQQPAHISSQAQPYIKSSSVIYRVNNNHIQSQVQPYIESSAGINHHSTVHGG